MGPVASRREATLCAVIACSILAMLALPVAAADGCPPDTEQFLGVGARADAMGNAFVAIANDPTAAYWNPAGLSFLNKTEVSAVVKTLPGITQDTYFGSTDFSVFPGFADGATTSSAGTSSGETAFIGISARIGKNPARGGTLSISRSLAGFLNRDWTIYQEFFPLELGEADTLTIVTRDELRVDYNTISYGWKQTDALSLGVGVLQAVAKNRVSGTVEETWLGDPEPFVAEIEPATIEGKGYGAIIGALWNPLFKGTRNLTVGASYLTKISLSNFEGASFGDERPDRLLLGANYRQPAAGDSENEVQWSLQLSRNGSANTEAGGDLARNSVWNFYFGGEYDIRRGSLSVPIRYGLFTNKTPNSNVYGSETWLTLGLGALQSAQEWKAELALQRGLRTGLSLLSFSGGYSF